MSQSPAQPEGQKPEAPKPVTPRPAATTLMLRDSPRGIEAFMVVRHDNMDFMGGQMVFPGGKVEFHDEDPELRPYCRGASGLDDTAFGLRVAAIRETFEESGLLLAYGRGEDHFLPHERLEQLAARYAKKVHAGEATLREIVERENIDLATDQVVPYAHWITPAHRAKRFDVHFFLAPAPDAHAVAVHDGHESVDSEWMTCDVAFDAVRQGRRMVPFPTQANLARLNKSKTVAEALAAARATKITTVQPYFVDGVRRLPEGCGYDHVEILPPKKDAAPGAPSPGR
jgi:8-oxo-dGTP pyrophosphatase MutT (NUDIX family)